MPTKESCDLAREELLRLKGVKEAFDRALFEGNVQRAKSIYRELREGIDALHEKVNPLENLLHIREQYEAHVTLLEQAGIVETLSTGEKGITAIDGNEYPLPSYSEVLERLKENRELIEKKHKQGFTKLLIVPFGKKLSLLVEAYGNALKRHREKGALKDPAKDPEGDLHLDTDTPVWVRGDFTDADTKETLVYDPESFTDEHRGKTKASLLSERAFDILLVEDMENLKAEGEGETIEGRKQLEAHKTPVAYLTLLKEDEQYRGETGYTPEAWLTYALVHLEETNHVIDDWEGKGRAAYLTGAYFKDVRRAPFAYWYQGYGRASLAGDDPGSRSAYFGARSAVPL